MENKKDDCREYTRRRFLNISGRLGTGLLLGAQASTVYASEEKSSDKKERSEAVKPIEDLMREHGILRRVLLIYEEFLRRIGEKEQTVKPELVTESANIIRKFIEDYHEKLEEDHIFPRFKKKNKQVELVDVLLEQHQAGRRLTERIQQLSMSSAADHNRLADSLRSFIRMYRPHATREDTVLFPDFRRIVMPSEYDELGEVFEDKEHKLFGKDGFEDMVGRVAGLEKQLGIYNISQFTPR